VSEQRAWHRHMLCQHTRHLLLTALVQWHSKPSHAGGTLIMMLCTACAITPLGHQGLSPSR
jgi:hypothetical protein